MVVNRETLEPSGKLAAFAADFETSDAAARLALAATTAHGT
jgi:hypothetical protein